MYPLARVSGAPHKAYIFRFNTPTNNTFPASGTHTCLILRGYPRLVPIHFWQKVRGLTPPLCSYIIRKVGSTPLLLNQLGSGILWCVLPYCKLGKLTAHEENGKTSKNSIQFWSPCETWAKFNLARSEVEIGWSCKPKAELEVRRRWYSIQKLRQSKTRETIR